MNSPWEKFQNVKSLCAWVPSMSCVLFMVRWRRASGTLLWLTLQKHGQETSSVLGKKHKSDAASKQKVKVIMPYLLSEF